MQNGVEQGVEEGDDALFDDKFLRCEADGVLLGVLNLFQLMVIGPHWGVFVVAEEDLLQFGADLGHGHSEEGQQHGNHAAHDEGRPTLRVPPRWGLAYSGKMNLQVYSQVSVMLKNPLPIQRGLITIIINTGKHVRWTSDYIQHSLTDKIAREKMDFYQLWRLERLSTIFGNSSGSKLL